MTEDGDLDSPFSLVHVHSLRRTVECVMAGKRLRGAGRPRPLSDEAELELVARIVLAISMRQSVFRKDVQLAAARMIRERLPTVAGYRPLYLCIAPGYESPRYACMRVCFCGCLTFVFSDVSAFGPLKPAFFAALDDLAGASLTGPERAGEEKLQELVPVELGEVPRSCEGTSLKLTMGQVRFALVTAFHSAFIRRTFYPAFGRPVFGLPTRMGSPPLLWQRCRKGRRRRPLWRRAMATSGYCTPSRSRLSTSCIPKMMLSTLSAAGARAGRRSGLDRD